MGRVEESIAEAKLAPYSSTPVSIYGSNWTLASRYYYARQYDQAIAQYRQMIEIEAE